MSCIVPFVVFFFFFLQFIFFIPFFYHVFWMEAIVTFWVFYCSHIYWSFRGNILLMHYADVLSQHSILSV